MPHYTPKRRQIYLVKKFLCVGLTALLKLEYIWKKILVTLRNFRSEKGINENPAPSSQKENDDEPNEFPSPPKRLPLHTEKVRELANIITEKDLKDMLLDRLCEINEKEGDIEKQAYYAVCLIDEISNFIESYNKVHQESLRNIQKELKYVLTSHNCELLDSDIWNPTIQRATRIDYCLPKNTEPRVVEKKSTGLKINNRLIRKQEVTLQKSKF